MTEIKRRSRQEKEVMGYWVVAQQVSASDRWIHVRRVDWQITVRWEERPKVATEAGR